MTIENLKALAYHTQTAIRVATALDVREAMKQAYDSMVAFDIYNSDVAIELYFEAEDHLMWTFGVKEHV
jgi:hypothetical protein